ncbi:hypothetical protein BKA62DRAFT_765653 [Auriculariales sp. MPI-PUGE-AT-0066]|nr:hypothetical protein BKA62DRAFT_765653 [Auriculariales sp. MPI-PUGE-AT-0066]
MPVPDWAVELSDKVKDERCTLVRCVAGSNSYFDNLGDRGRFLQSWSIIVRDIPDRTYPSPEYLNEEHVLWPTVLRALADMGEAENFHRMAEIVDDLNSLLHEDEIQIPATIALRRGTLSGGHIEESPYKFVDFEAVQEKTEVIARDFIQAALQPEGILHKETLQRGFPSQMIWNPPPAWKADHPEVYAHLQTMTIPVVPFSKTNEPDMLLYALGSFEKVDPNIALKLKYPVRRFLLLADSSGTGKTRFILEYLSQAQWGCYFTFEVDPATSPYGSADLSHAIVLMRDGRFRRAKAESFVPVVEPSDISDDGSLEKQRLRWERRWQNNSTIARHAFTNLLLARILVYDAFCKAIKASGVQDLRTLQRAWCLLQAVPHLSGHGDIFLNMFRTVQLVSEESAATSTQNMLERLKDSKFPVLGALAVDEAQSGTRTFSTCFGPSSQSPAIDFKEMTRPVLKPFVQAVFLQGTFHQLVVSGTKIDQAAVVEALTSTVAKQASLDRGVQPILGENDTATRINRVLNLFFGKEFAEHLTSGTRREILFWTQGRHRFLAVLISAIFQAGPSEDNVNDILLDLVSKLSGHNVRRSDGPNFPSIAVDNIIPRIIQFPENPEHAERVRDLETVLVNFLLTRRYDRHHHYDSLEKLVEIGIGRFAKPCHGKPSIKVVFNENLILIALWAWFSLTPQGGKSRLHRYLQLGKAAANPVIAGFGWEDVVAYMLWCWFAGAQPAKLNHVFQFLGSQPSWGGDVIRLVQTLQQTQGDDISTSGTMSAILASPGTTLGLSYQTATPEETILAIRPEKLEEATNGLFQQRGYAFIKPDSAMGPDLLAIGLLPDETLLLIVVQCKDLSRKLSSAEILEILAKLAPDKKGWWCRSAKRSKKCQGYVDEIEKLFPVGGTNPTENLRSSSIDVYDGLPGCAVLRVIAAPELDKPDDSICIGPWPAALFSPAAMECTAEEFDSVKVSLRKAQDAQDEEIKEALASLLKRQPVTRAPVPIATRTHDPSAPVRQQPPGLSAPNLAIIRSGVATPLL